MEEEEEESYYETENSQQISAFMNELQKRGPMNLDTSDIMPKQVEKKAPKIEETKQSSNEKLIKKEEVKVVPPIPTNEIPKDQPAQLSTNRIGSKIDHAKLNKIQYSAQKPATTENAKHVESEESESVYETESSQQHSNFVMGFQKKEEKPPTSGSDQKKVSDWDSSTSHKVQIQEPVLKLGNLKMFDPSK